MAEWAFNNGYDIMIPHPNPSRLNPKSVAESAFGVQIGIGKEAVESVLRLAEKHNRFAYIAYANGTTTADYRGRLLGNKEHFWQFWRTPKPTPEVRDLYAKRAVWVAEADAHIHCEYPSNMVYFRRSQVVGKDGRVSAEKISRAVEKQHKLDYAAFGEGKAIPEEERIFVSYSADSSFNPLDRLTMVPYFVREYARLAAVWLVKIATGKAGQYAAKPKRSLDTEQQRAPRYEDEG